MTVHQARRLIRLYEKAELHAVAYRRLSMERSAQSKALRHLEKSERFYSQVRGLLRDCSSATA